MNVVDGLDQRTAHFRTIARAMADATKDIKTCHVGKLSEERPAYGERVADAPGIPLSAVPK